MPKYDYNCSYCEEVREYEHPMENTLEAFTCKVCEVGLLHKVFRPASTHFKGQGWGKVYRDHRRQEPK